MRLLANENFPLDAVAALREAGHDVVWIREGSRGTSDDEILFHAQKENRIVVTFNKDFGELAFRSKLPAQSGVILFRITPNRRNISRKRLFRRLRVETTGLDISLLWKTIKSA